MFGTNRPSPQRFPGAIILLSLAAACGGGGGGGPADSKPTIVTATYLGLGPSPSAGDTLQLTFSETVTLASGKLLTDADLTLSGGGTLGSVTTAPTLLTSNTVWVTLGTGVSFTPNTTTVALGATNDVVVDASGQLGDGGTAVTIGTSDGSAPSIANVTIDGIDSALNGTGSAGGTLQVPANGFTIDLAYSDNTAIATAQTQITANVAVSTASGSQLAGTNLVPFLTAVSATNTAASYRVPSTVSFPNGPVTLSALVVDTSGLASTPSTFAATVRAFNDALRPFETAVNASQVWYLDFTRDVESYTTQAITGGVQVDVTSGANGRADFEEILIVLGLLSAAPTAVDCTATVLSQFKTALLSQLATLYSDANITFTLTQPSGSFGGSSSVAYNSLGYSQISIAGASSSAGVLGVAIFNPNNTTQDDDTQTNFSGIRLGIFLHTMVDAGFAPPSSSLFRLTFDSLAPSLGGTPIGNTASDDLRLTGATTGTRTNEIRTAIDDFARFTSVVLAHECGHSMGLVQNGAMPLGLYGNDSTNFPGSSDGHIRNTALFPTGSTNVMSPSLSYSTTLNTSTAFNTLNLAYLRERVLYGN